MVNLSAYGAHSLDRCTLMVLREEATDAPRDGGRSFRHLRGERGRSPFQSNSKVVSSVARRTHLSARDPVGCAMAVERAVRGTDLREGRELDGI
jgi:hypothetical protein